MKLKSLLLFFVLVQLFSACTQSRYVDALSPEDALKSFDLNKDFNIEIFAAEPIVADPVDLVFDEQGRAFVVEMPDYPYKPEPGKGLGKIKMLTDTNGDGRMDKATIFAENITEATSILPWKGGLIVTAAPNIWYMKDTDGDLKADVKEILYEGFFENNSEAQITNLRFGVDNWIYASNHGQAGTVTDPRSASKKTLDMRGADFRFRMDKDAFEQETGNAQFGQTFDDFGHRFMTENSIRIRQMVMAWRYARRNEFSPFKNAVVDITDKDNTMFQVTPAPYWRAERTKRRNADYKEKALDRIEYAEDYFTGASGGTVYTGHTFPEEYQGNFFVGDVAGSLVHRDVLQADLASPVFKAFDPQKASNKEFLSSSDPWFRPANFTVGPDGALYVIDFYRQHIETPVSIPEDLKADMDFMKGSDRGRIYRITPKNPVSTDSLKVNLGKLSAQELVSYLAHPNQWQRLQAQRLLLEKQDKTIKPALMEMMSRGNPKAKLHAFYVLDGLGIMEEKVVEMMLSDPHPGIKEHGLQIAEKYSNLIPKMAEMVDDTSARVSFQAILSLGDTKNGQTTKAMRKIVSSKMSDSWYRMAVLSTKSGLSKDLIDSLKTHSDFFDSATSDRTKFINEFAYSQGGNNQDTEIAGVLEILRDSTLVNQKDWVSEYLSGLADGRKANKEVGELGKLTVKQLNMTNEIENVSSGKVIEELLK